MAAIRVIVSSLVVVLFTFWQIVSVSSLTCYTCSGYCNGTDKNMTCPDGTTKCFSAAYDNGSVYVAACATTGLECELLSNCETCSSDYCNSSYAHMPVSFIFIITSILVGKYYIN